jgi:hypothetical protein
MKNAAYLPIATLLLFAASVCANASTTVGVVISRVPYTISKPGDYRLSKDLVMTTASGSAITITASNATLDLNGFTLSAAPAADIVGVFGISIEAPHVTVRDGTIIGFGRCVNGYSGPEYDSQVVEDLTCEAPVGNAGLYLFGADTFVTRVHVTNPTRALSAPTGIYANYSSHIEDCSVSDLHAAAGSEAIAYELDDGPGDEAYTVLVRDSVASNLTADSGNVYGIIGGAKNTIVDHCYFFNLTSAGGPTGNGSVMIKDSVFRSCGASPLAGVTDGGGNINEP